MIIDQGEPTTLGTDAEGAVISFRAEPGRPEGWMGRRELAVRGEALFELSFWCGTCPFLFDRLARADQLSFDDVAIRLAAGLDEIDAETVDIVGTLLPWGEYLPVLLEVIPTLVAPGSQLDYFTHEQQQTWSEPTQDPKTDYYRTFTAPVAEEAHLYEFVVPLVPVSFNDADQVAAYAREIEGGAVPTAVAVSTLDVTAPATDQGPDWYWHWGLTHFLLDGHHKFAAAASAGKPVRLLTLIALGSGLSDEAQVLAALDVRRSVTSHARSNPPG